MNMVAARCMGRLNVRTDGNSRMGETTPIYGDDAETNAAMEEARRARHGLRIELQRSGARSTLIAILLAGAAMLEPNALFADTIPVRHTEGLIHGFLVVRTLEGKALAALRL